MDRDIVKLERAYDTNPQDVVLRDRLIHQLTRYGRLYDARKLVQKRLSNGRFDLKDIQHLADLGRKAGFIQSYPVRRCDLMNFSALFHSQKTASTIEIEIGFAGLDGAGALVSVLALANFFKLSASGLSGSGIHSLEDTQSEIPVLGIHKPGETSYEFRLPLHEPWPLSKRFRLGAIRITTVPTAPTKVTLRRKVLRSVNALAFVPDTRSDGTGETNEDIFRRLNFDFEKIWQRPLRQFRLALQYLEPTRHELHRALQCALGLSRNPRIQANIETSADPAPRPKPLFGNFRVGRNEIMAHEGVLDTFAILLLRVIKDLSRI